MPSENQFMALVGLFGVVLIGVFLIADAIQDRKRKERNK